MVCQILAYGHGHRGVTWLLLVCLGAGGEQCVLSDAFTLGKEAETLSGPVGSRGTAGRSVGAVVTAAASTGRGAAAPGTAPTATTVLSSLPSAEPRSVGSRTPLRH